MLEQPSTYARTRRNKAALSVEAPEARVARVERRAAPAVLLVVGRLRWAPGGLREEGVIGLTGPLLGDTYLGYPRCIRGVARAIRRIDRRHVDKYAMLG
jgi:hypothetical protein